MVRHLWLFVILALGVASCVATSPADRAMSLEGFAHRVANSDVVLLWNCSPPTSGPLRVEGVVYSPWQAQPIRFMELQMVGVDAQGRQTGEAAWKSPDIQLFTNQRSSFLLELRTTGAEARLDLYYQYLMNEEYDTAMLAGPPMVVPRLHAQTKTNVIRDACSPTQHLAR